MSAPSSTATADVYASIWAGAVGAATDVVATIGAPCRAIYVGSAGTLVVVRPDGVSVTIGLVAAGATLPIQAKAITAVGSTAHTLLLIA